MEKNSYFKPNQGSGDDGFTDLLGGKRVPKSHIIVKLNAFLDELSANFGLLRAELLKKFSQRFLFYLDFMP